MLMTKTIKAQECARNLSWQKISCHGKTGIQAEVKNAKIQNHSALVTAACAVAIHRKFMALVLSDAALFSTVHFQTSDAVKFWIVDQAELEKLVSGV